MRDSHICPKCDHRVILRVAEVADATGDAAHESPGRNAPTSEGVSKPLRLARLPEPEKGFFSAIGSPMAGLVQAYACRGCGYTEFYTSGVAEIPVDGELVSILRGPEKVGPYR